MAGELRNWAVMSVVGVIWLALIIVGVATGDIHQFSIIADVVPVLLVGAAIFERWGWRLPFLHPYLVSTPVLRGTWKGDLESLWLDPETKERRPTKTVYLAIEQSLTESVIRLMSDESSSEQVAGSTRRRPGGRFFMSAVYLNTPRIDRRGASPIHFGSVVLDVHGTAPSRLEGEYWTERPSKGRLIFTTHSPKVAESFEEATRLIFKAESA